MTEQNKERDRLLVIMQVFAGVLTATEGAQRLGVSRKTYYEWQERAITAMQEALKDRTAGRPKAEVDPQIQRLREQVEDLNNQLSLAQKTIEVKNILTAYVQQQRLPLDGTSGNTGKKSPDTGNHEPKTDEYAQ